MKEGGSRANELLDRGRNNDYTISVGLVSDVQRNTAALPKWRSGVLAAARAASTVAALVCPRRSVSRTFEKQSQLEAFKLTNINKATLHKDHTLQVFVCFSWLQIIFSFFMKGKKGQKSKNWQQIFLFFKIRKKGKSGCWSFFFF